MNKPTPFRSLASFFFIATIALVSAAHVQAAEPVGNVVSVEGKVEIQRASVWQDAAVGAPVFVGDRLRTGRPGRMSVVFRDDSVITLAEESELTIDEHVYGEAGGVRSLFNMLQGSVRSFVSDYYRDGTAAYEVVTETAVSGVRGTDFIVVYDRDDERTDVVGITGTIAVDGRGEGAGAGVTLSGREMTVVRRGKAPTLPRTLSEDEMGVYRKATDFVGDGAPESLTKRGILGSGQIVPPPDKPTLTIVPSIGGGKEIAPPGQELKGGRTAGGILRDSGASLSGAPGTGDLIIRY